MKRISVEQTIGRILRLPNTKEKKQQELNVSYVYTSSRNFKEAASSLEKGLLANGYTKKDLKELTKKIKTENIFAKIFDDKNIKIPYIAVKDGIQYRQLEYYSDLVGEDFDLSKQKPPTDFIWDFDQNRTQKVDIDKDDLFKRSAQTKLDVVYEHKDFSKERLLNWLDKKVLRKEYSQDEKRIFFEKLIDDALASKQYTLSELSINCYKLKEIIEDYIDQLEYEKSSATFSKLEKYGKLSLDKVFMEFSDTITIDNTSEDRFTKHLYEKAGTLNLEELDLALKIDQLENIKWWYRSMEKKDFFIQGWRRDKFYPDYIIKTDSGKYLIVEYKGENLLTNVDTKYKVELGKKWKVLAGDNYEFYLVSKKNTEKFITEIKKL